MEKVKNVIEDVVESVNTKELKDYSELSFKEYILKSEDIKMSVKGMEGERVILNKHVNSADDEMLIILVGMGMKDKGKLNSDLSFQKLVFKEDTVNAYALDTKGDMKKMDVTDIYKEVVESLGYAQ